MAVHLRKTKGVPRAIGDRVLVSDMDFGEQKTKGGLIIGTDDGTTRGIYPRWAKVFSKGPRIEHDAYEVGQWILIEHGRWTRSFVAETPDGDIELRMVESESVLGYSDEKPNDVRIGAEYSDGEHATVDPSAFVNSSGALT
jgi:co-chaperonin GroES (HSP10)